MLALDADIKIVKFFGFLALKALNICKHSGFFIIILICDLTEIPSLFLTRIFSFYYCLLCCFL